MTDKISKLLSKLSKKDLKRLEGTISKIANLEFEGLDIKTIKGQSGIYRVREGSFRIIFNVDHNKKTNILAISRRNEKTYKDI